ncbi:outer membrane autotransporter barrel [Methylorubrum populi]|uniref:Outer membrane autotransporter barrel n=1 Tax=Methylorubrum populi TaxID=223967 RepID=A0A169R0N0_9HYPH|nr:autotransporter domain-containing protein [Methylorubrum populi]BAU90982.1 outer membrane autotransporter barrel [Methylorubrum populi]
MTKHLLSFLLASTGLVPLCATAQQIPTSPGVGFTNSTSASTGTVIPRVLDSYVGLMTGNPAAMTQNYQTVITMTQNRTADQTFGAIRDDRTSQAYGILNGLGPLTSAYLTGAGATFSGTRPNSLTPTSYATTKLADYAANINLGSSASAGVTTFGNGTATPLAAAVDFIDNVARGNASTEPSKRVFGRYQGTNPAIDPLDARFNDYSAATNKRGLSVRDTAGFVVPTDLANFPVPAVYGTTDRWVKGFTVTQAMIDANGGRPLTAPNVGSYDAAGTFTPTTFGVGEYVPGIGTSPRPYRVSTSVNVPTLLFQRINGTNAYADGGYPSGHTNSGYLQSLGVGFLVPQRFQELLTRAAELGNNRILAGMHSPFDVMGGRMQSAAIVATNIYGALYDAQGNAVDWTNPANTRAYAVFQAYRQTQAYLAASCGASSVGGCLAASAASGAADAFANAAQNKADYTARLTYGFQPTGPSVPMTAAEVPVQAQVLLLTRFPYLSDTQRREILATTGLPSGYPLLSGNTYDGWGRLNLYAAMDGYAAFNGPVTVTMDASQGGYRALDTWKNDIAGSGSLTKAGSGTLILTGRNTYTGGTTVAGGTLVGSTASFGSGAIVDNGSLILDQASDAAMANPISGSGILTKSGAGTLNLTGTSSFTGATGVAEGRLAVNGSLAGSTVTVGSGASLGGNGTVGGVVAASGATVAPGNSIGTLNVAGNVTFAANSVYAVEANAAGQSDRIAAGGSASLNGTVQVSAANGTYDPRTRTTILTAGGGVTGQFAGVTANLAFLTPTLIYSANAVDLNLTRNDIAFSTVARNRNQAGVADAIQAGGAGTAPYQHTVGLTTSQAQGAFQALSGDVHASTVSTAYATAFFVREAILDRLRWGTTPGTANGLNYGSLPAAYTADLPGRATPAVAMPARILDPTVFGLWGQGFGSFGEARSDGNAAGFSQQISGFALGADIRLENGIKLGVAGGYTAGSLDTTGRLQSGTIESAFGGVYGGYELGPVSLRLGATYADNTIRTRRTIAFAGLSDSASARTGGATIQGFGEIGYRFFLGDGAPAPLLSKDGPAPVQASLSYIEPFLGGSYVAIGRDRFVESGGVAALTSFARDYDVGAVTAGLRAQTLLGLDLGAPVSARGLVGYRRAFGDVVPTALLSFGNGPTFLSAGIPIARDALVAEAGLDLQVALNATLGVAYTGQVGERVQDHAVKGNFTWRF